MIRWLQPMAAGTLALVCFTNAALPQRSTTEEITLLATAWTEICVAPCRVQVTGSDGALVSIGSTAPATLNAPAMFIGAALLEGLPVRAAGKRVYARGWSRTTTLVAVPDDGAGPGGAVLPPFVGADKRKITKCSVAANGATLLACTIDNGQAVASPAGVCPPTSLPMVTEIKTTVGGVGLGLNGQALTTGVEGTAAGTPDMPLPTANTLYTLPIGATNAITAYNPNGSPALVTCIQTLRP